MKNPALSLLILCFCLSYFANAQDFNKPSPNRDYKIGLDYYQQNDYVAAHLSYNVQLIIMMLMDNIL